MKPFQCERPKRRIKPSFGITVSIGVGVILMLSLMPQGGGRAFFGLPPENKSGVEALEQYEGMNPASVDYF